MQRLAAHALFVVVVGGAGVFLHALQSSGVDLLLSSTLLWVVVVVALVVVERLVPFRAAWQRPDEQLGNDLAHTALGSALGSRAGVVVADLVVAAVALAFPASTLWPSSAPFWAQVVVGFVVVDGLRYAQHPSHFSVSDALSWIDRFKPKRAVITNMHSDLDYEVVRSKLPANVIPAYDGMRLELDHVI